METEVRAIDAYELQKTIFEEFIRHGTVVDRERIQTALDILRIIDRCVTIPIYYTEPAETVSNMRDSRRVYGKSGGRSESVRSPLEPSETEEGQECGVTLSVV